MSDVRKPHSRREALKCLAYGGAGTLFALSGGVFTPIDLARAAIDKKGTARLGKPLFVQISDTHSVKAGVTVTWTNMDQEPHTVMSSDGSFRSGALDTGDSFSFKFDKPAPTSMCVRYPRMVGTVVVE
jgi:plastocyanin